WRPAVLSVRTSFTRPGTIYGSRDNEAGGPHRAEHPSACIRAEPDLGDHRQIAHCHAWCIGDLAIWLVVFIYCAVQCLRQASISKAAEAGGESLGARLASPLAAFPGHNI